MQPSEPQQPLMGPWGLPRTRCLPWSQRLEDPLGIIHGGPDKETTECPPLESWVKKRWCRFTREADSAIRKDEILPLAATWVHLESTMLSRMSQREVKNRMMSLVCGTRNGKQHTDEQTRQTETHRLSRGGGQREGGGEGRGKGGHTCDDGRLEFGGEHIMQYTGDVSQNSTLEIHILLSYREG